jgi:hypothetical protein
MLGQALCNFEHKNRILHGVAVEIDGWLTKLFTAEIFVLRLHFSN